MNPSTLTLSASPANDNARCEGCGAHAGRDGLCAPCDSELAAHLDAGRYFNAEAYFAAGDDEGALLAAGVSVDDGARFAADDGSTDVCATCDGAREFRGEPTRHNPSGVHDCPDCG
jgi:hypothetical protein